MRKHLWLTLVLITWILAGCVSPSPQSFESLQGEQTPLGVMPTSTPFQPNVTATSPLQSRPLRIWLPDYLPERLRKQIPATLTLANSRDDADLRLDLSENPGEGVPWIYVLVAPFPTVTDEVSLDDLRSAWQGGAALDDLGNILVTQTTYQVMQNLLGAPAAQRVTLVDEQALLDTAWSNRPALAIIPFEALEPRWKVLKVDGQSPLDKTFDPLRYPLAVWFAWRGSAEALVQWNDQQQAVGLSLTSNYHAEHLTRLIMTGVTALVRATAAKMEEKGMTYPARDIGDLLRGADLTHISNEVSFSPVCPPPNPNQTSLIFCSDPRYIELLDYVGTDILELTGNHGVDWGRDALLYSLNLYRQRGWAFYAAGENEAAAKAAVTLEHNGNKFAFIGCNPAGPAFIWATPDLPGVANCDYPWMQSEIRRLTEAGYIVIATFQYFESYRPDVLPYEQRDFRSLADAGAVIVSGSQAHHPMAMEFYGNSFIHYGLGNLFFDQMHVYIGDRLIEGTRKEFIDEHVFYEGKHISTILHTAMLEDYARPRPMTPEERSAFLSQMFSVSGW